MAVDRFGSEEEIAKLRAIFQTGAYRDRSLISREGVHAGMSFVTVDGFATEAEGIAGVGGDEEAYELLWELRGRMRDKICGPPGRTQSWAIRGVHEWRGEHARREGRPPGGG